MFEIDGKEGQYEILSSTDNDVVLFHTIHFVLPSMWSINPWCAIGSDERFQCTRQLTKDTSQPYSIDDSLDCLTDRQDGL